MTAWANSTRSSRLPPDWPRRRAKVLKRDGRLCQIRGPLCTGTANEVDHIARGDDHELTNLQAACVTCHRAKTLAERPAALRKRPAAKHPGLV